MLDRVLKGDVPAAPEVVDLYDMVVSTRDLRRPVRLEEQLLGQHAFENEVSLAMLQLLQGPTGAVPIFDMKFGIDSCNRSLVWWGKMPLMIRSRWVRYGWRV